MLLVIDIGNTSTTIGVYEEDKLLNNWKIASNKKQSEDEYGLILNGLLSHAGLLDKLHFAVISSVVLPLTERLKLAVEKYLKIPVLVITSKINTGIILDVNKPKEVGADRIVNAYAAYKLHDCPAVVVDFGTATTFDIVSKDGRFIGGVIAPGIGISADALSALTSLLPKVRIEAPPSTIGKNTVDAMLSGLVRGHAAMIDGIIQSIEKELNSPVTTIATGGYSSMITDCLNRPFDYLSPHLTLEGMRLLFELNKKS